MTRQVRADASRSMRCAAAAAVAILGAGTLLSTHATGFEPLFDTWVGFETGTYATGRFSYAACADDLDGDGDPDVVVARWPWATGFSVLVNDGGGGYSAPTHYSSAQPSLDVATGDFDRDGRADVVVPNSGQNWEGSTVSLYLNQGGATFAPPAQFTVGNGAFVGPIGLAVADFDGDQNLDLAVAKWGWLGSGTTVALLRGNGAGGLAPFADIQAGEGPYKLAAGDLNGDARPDLVVATDEQRVRVLLNDGGGGFAAPVSYTALTPSGGDFYPAVALADVDRDQDLDVLYSSTRTWINDDTGVIVLFRNLGGGALASPELIPLVRYSAGPVDLAAGDVNGDGWVDVAGAHFDGRAGDGWMLALGDGGGGFLPAVLYPAGQQTVAVLFADVDGDQDTDVLSADNFSMEVTVHENLGGGLFRVPPTYPVEPISIDLDAADIDGDGDLDIATSGGTTAGTQGSILRNLGDGTFAPRTTFGIPGGVAYARLRDLDNDAFPDLLFASASPPYNFHTAMNDGNGTFGPVTTWPIGSCGSGHVDAFDLEGDKDLDVVFAEYLACPGIPESGRRLYISLNRGDGTFDPPIIMVVDPNPFALAGGLFNGDSFIDLAVAHWGVYGANNWVDVLLGRGDGTFQAPQIYFVGQGPNGIVAADLDGDMILDLATCNTGSGGSGIETMSVLTGNGDGTFQGAVTYWGSYSPDLLGTTGITSGDPDRDGDPDLMVGNAGSSDVSIYANRGDGTFEPAIRYGANKGAHAPFYGDFTGDGTEDLAAAVGLPPSGLFGAVSIVHGIPQGAAGIAAAGPAPAAGLHLDPARPNPFNPRTSLAYEIPAPGRARLGIYDALGRRVALLADGAAAAGRHQATWDGRDERGRPLPSGAYFVRLEQGGSEAARKILLIR